MNRIIFVVSMWKKLFLVTLNHFLSSFRMKMYLSELKGRRFNTLILAFWSTQLSAHIDLFDSKWIKRRFSVLIVQIILYLRRESLFIKFQNGQGRIETAIHTLSVVTFFQFHQWVYYFFNNSNKLFVFVVNSTNINSDSFFYNTRSQSSLSFKNCRV